MRRLSVAIGLALLLLALLGAGWVYRDALVDLSTGWLGAEDGGDRRRPPPLVETATAEQASIARRISATGTLTAPERVTVTAQSAGRVASIHFKEGDAVQQDQTLVILERERAEAAVEEAAARVERQDRALARRRELNQQEFVSQSEIDRVEAQLEQARAQLRIANEELANRVIEAPFAGVIGRRLISVGAFLQPGIEIATLVRLTPLDLLFDVPGIHVGQVARGQRVTATTAAFPAQTFAGEVSFVGTRVSRATRTLPVEATFSNDDGRLKPGMYLQAELMTGEQQVVQVPEAAILTRGPRTLIYVVEESGTDAAGAKPSDDGRSGPPPGADAGATLSVRRRPVETGARREGWVAIRKGLEPGERVVVRGLQTLRDGMTVRTDGGRSGNERAANEAAAEQPQTAADANGNPGAQPGTGHEAGR